MSPCTSTVDEEIPLTPHSSLPAPKTEMLLPRLAPLCTRRGQRRYNESLPRPGRRWASANIAALADLNGQPLLAGMRTPIPLSTATMANGKPTHSRIPLACPRCRALCQIPATLGGQRVRCPDCGMPFEVPTDASGADIQPKAAAAGTSTAAYKMCEPRPRTLSWQPESAAAADAMQQATASLAPARHPRPHTGQTAAGIPDHGAPRRDTPAGDAGAELPAQQHAVPQQAIPQHAPAMEAGGVNPRSQDTPAVHSAAEYPAAVQSPPREEDLVRVKCRVCGTLLYFSVHEVGQQARCPDCEVAFTIPPPSPPAPPPTPPADPGEYAVGAEPPRVRPTFEYLARPREQPAESPKSSLLPPPADDEHPLPRLWYLTGVVDLPWRRNNIVRWAVLAVLLAAAELLSHKVVQGLAAAQSWGAALVPLMLMVPAILAVIGALLCGLAWFHIIFRETAAGEEEIEDWSGGDVLGWITSAFFMAYYALLAWALAAVIVRVLPWAADSQVVRLAVTLLLFWAWLPVVLLASLEAESPWIPWSVPVYVRLGQRARDFVKAYLTEVGFMVLLFGLVWMAGQVSGVLAMVVGSILEAALVFIIARLLGRLAVRMRQRRNV